ncbi:hypothetical protein HGRIS_010177 [Hohenbuehelia grisea]|uniref:GPI inositol-deacylase n=1 Tax=Hohenbuehelia grisea TaxID=104357 RepID=A0ABR3J3I5_9AGAR
MSPEYVLQSDFNERWTPLARRYSLWLYREDGWESGRRPGGQNTLPVLFIPGNAGSFKQVRSIASSATRQYYTYPGVVNEEFTRRREGGSLVKPLDFFAVEFNEDLSAFHGTTLESQTTYTSRAIAYILSLYPPGTQILVLGHSMGGIVATSLLTPLLHGLAHPSNPWDLRVSEANISGVITMSTPHTLPPARFDARIDGIYDRNQVILARTWTPIVSLCGGATDMMIPSEACILPPLSRRQGVDEAAHPFRRTVFSAALEGSWTGVGHQVMVWCHQVRWRVARAALELGTTASLSQRTDILSRWLRDGHSLQPSTLEGSKRFSLSPSDFEVLPDGTQAVLKHPRVEKPRSYLLPIPSVDSDGGSKFLMFVSQGAVGRIAPQNAVALRVSVGTCRPSEAGVTDSATVSTLDCRSLPPVVLKLIPNPVPGKTFPVPHEGTDESEGVVLFEADIPGAQKSDQGDRYVSVTIESADGRGWVVGGFKTVEMRDTIGTLGLALGGVTLSLPTQENPLRTQVEMPNLLTNVLVVYRLTPVLKPRDQCSETLLPPLVMHTSHQAETHYYPLMPISTPSHRILLHSHGAAPYVSSISGLIGGLRFVIYSSGASGCDADIVGLRINLDWSATIGRLVSRYPTTVVCWAVGVVALVLFGAWGISDTGATMPSVHQSLIVFCRRTLPYLMFVSFWIAFLPLPERYYLGTGGQPLFAPLAPLLLLVATGLVCTLWAVLLMIMWPLAKFGAARSPRNIEYSAVRKTTVVSMSLIFLAVFLFVPWQVAYLVCWIIHLFTCASFGGLSDKDAGGREVAIPLVSRDGGDQPVISQKESLSVSATRIDNANHCMHILLLMTWLLPLAAPTLAVWVRTLFTAGFTTPFDGDHFVLSVAPFLILVDFVSWAGGGLLQPHSTEDHLSLRWAWVALAFVAFFFGPRKVYLVFDFAKIVVGLIVLLRIGPRYLGKRSWAGRG